MAELKEKNESFFFPSPLDRKPSYIEKELNLTPRSEYQLPAPSDIYFQLF